jgi:glycosyltransferase involved in cell wall biosynthesis
VRVAIDARSAMPHVRTGIGTYTWQLVRRLPAAAPDTTFIAWYLDARGVLGLRSRRRLFADIRAPNFSEVRMPIPTSWFDRASLRFDRPRLEWMVGYDVLFAPNFVPPPTRRGRLVLTVHDLAFARFPETAPSATRRWLERLDGSLRRAAHVIVVSEQTRRDLLASSPARSASLEGRVSVIPLAIDPGQFRPADEAAVAAARARYGISGSYLLSLTGIEPRKNLPGLVTAWASLPGSLRPQLVLAGPAPSWSPDGWNLLRPTLEGLPAAIRDEVVITGFVGEEEKVALLSGAEALAYPSLYEGFGLPVLEAMACGTPVLTSDVSALPETAGSAALLVDPREPEAIADGLRRVLSDADLRTRLRTAGLERAATFRWEETARRTAEVLRQASG